MSQTTLQYIMHDIRQRGLWCLFIFLFILSASAQSLTQGTPFTPSNNQLLQLRQELVDTIKELSIGDHDPGLEDAVTELLSQLEHLQSVPGGSFQLEWERPEGPNTTNSKTVCFVVSSFEGLYLNSGIGTAYYALAELLAQGHQVTVLYARDQPPTVGSFHDWVKHYASKNIRLTSLPPSAKRITNPKLQTTSIQVYQFLKLNHFDIVHFHDFEGLGFYPTLAKRVGLTFEDTLFVVGLHGPTRWVLDANEDRIPTHESELEVDWMERTSVENADVVWTPSNTLASWLSNQGWNFSRGVSLLPLPPGPEVRGVHDSVHVKAKELVFFGRLEKRKGLMLFCDSVDLLSHMDSVRVGLTITFLGTTGFVDGHDSVAFIRTRSAAWPFAINIITNVTRQGALEYLSDRTAGRIPVIPSLVDNAPYTVWECLYAGIPFLASATPSITPLLAKNGHHLFELKPHHLASRMVYAVKNGLSSAKGTFSATDAEDTWMSFYSQLRLPQPEITRTGEQPLVSVCVVHYNRPELVQQAIASISEQDYKKIEVILVDDGSNNTDAVEYINSLQSSFDAQGWKIIRTSNRFLGAARNTAARQAQGKYILFFDDDNIAFPNQISTYVKAAEHTKANILTAGHAIFKGFGAPSAQNVDRIWYPLGPSLAVGLFKNCFGDANFFVEKDAFLAIGGFTEEHGVGLEEHEFFAKAVFSGLQLEVIPEPLLYYRIHDEANQMIFSLDPRLGEARRIRPYLDALAPAPIVANGEEGLEMPEETMKTRRSLVHLVARNNLQSYADCNQTLSSVTPVSGPVSGGTTITLSGVGFSCGVQAVRIDGVECTGIDIVSNFEITCQTPPGNRTYTPVDITADVGGTTIALYAKWIYTSLAAPAMDSCRLSDDGTSIACSFSSNTAQTAGACSSFFSADSVSSFGSGANCFWTSSTVLTIDLGAGATISIGDSVSILAGSVKSQGDNNVVNAASSTPLLAPLSAPSPVASISTTSNVGSCQGIDLDASSATGGLGRSLTFAWSLVSIEPASSTSQDAVNTVLSQANSGKVSISADDVAQATYVFSLTVTNWIGATATTTATVTKSSENTLSVSISGPSVIQTYKNSVLTLNGLASSSCGGVINAPVYAWTISPSVSIDASALSTASLSVPENTFAAGTSYTVTLSVSDNGQSNSASVTVSVGARPLVASISGGDKQYRSDDTVTLDGSASSDPEGESLSFAWSCVNFHDSSKPCSISGTTDNKWSFSASSLGAGKFTITLAVSGSLSRSASSSVWVEVSGISVLDISIQALAADPVDSTSALSLTGLLNQAGVSVSEISWSWSLTSGSLNNPSTAYSSPMDAQVLVIAADALTPGAQYTYKLSATQSSTGVSGTATITFSVAKGITTGELGCAVTTGTAESTDFSYDFGKMWASASGIVSYEIRFVPEGSLLEIPLAEPSAETTFTTKLPAGRYTIVGIAHSGNGVSARKECSADVQAPDNYLSQLATRASASGLAPFEIARIAFGAKSAYSESAQSSFDNVRTPLISAVQSALGGLTASGATALTAAYLVISDVDLGTLAQSNLIPAINTFGNLLDTQGSVSGLNMSVFQADVAILSNLVAQISQQDFDVKVLRKRSDEDLWASFQSLIAVANKVAAQYSSKIPNGQSQITISQAMLTLSLLSTSSSSVGTQGVELGKQAKVTLPPGSVTGASDNVAFSLSAWGVSPYPGSAQVVSPILILSAFSSGSVLNLQDVTTPASIFVPNSELTDTQSLDCVAWSAADSKWDSEPCETSAASSGVTCSCTTASAAFAVISTNPSRASPGGNDKNGGLEGKWIGVIAGVGGVALIAAIVGGVFVVNKRRRASQATGATPAVASGPAPSDSDAISVVVPVAAVAAAAGTETPRSVSGSSYSSASSRSIVSSSSSEEEVMEQQIKDIVGELSSALPRDPRALEVLGDKLDME